jgi:transcriptional regulator GlxA family with amidase domain
MKNDSIAVVAFNGITPFHLSIPCVVFRPDPEIKNLPAFEIKVCAAEPSPLRTSAGFSISTDYDLSSLAQAQTVIVPGWRNVAEMPPLALLDALIKAKQQGARIVGFVWGHSFWQQPGYWMVDQQQLIGVARTNWHDAIRR